MSKAPLFHLQSFRLRHFKAVRDSGVVRFGDFTLLIGNNGSGKSSLIEGLQTYWDAVHLNPGAAFQRWRGFEHIFSHAKKLRKGDDAAIIFAARGRTLGRGFRSDLEIAAPGNMDVVVRRFDRWQWAKAKPVIYRWNRNFDPQEFKKIAFRDDTSPSGRNFSFSDTRWQFVNFAPALMGQPYARSRDPGMVPLAHDGANLAEVILQLRERSPDVLAGVVETVAGILGYGRDLQPITSSAVERMIHLSLVEDDFQVPGWLLSSGTLRLVALLALLRDPTPPELLVIEELENGLDPRTVALVIDEIRTAVKERRTQVIATTHSPYLLDLVQLEHLLLVQRNATGEPEFLRPADNHSLQEWAKKFSPGRLYTMGNLTEG